MQIVRRAIIPLTQSYRRNRNRYASLLAESHKWTPEQAKREQQVRLAETLQHCLREVPFYRDRIEVDPESIRPETAEETLHLFPMLTSTMVKEHFDDLQVRPRPQGAFLNRSGGTTGQPTVFYLDQDSEDWVRGAKRYHSRLTGHQTGDSLWVIWGSPEEYRLKKRSRKARMMAKVNHVRRIRGFSLSTQDLDHLLDEIEQKAPTRISTYADILDRLAARAEETNRIMPKTMRMMVTAGTLYVPMRQRIERVFGSKLFNCYGSREFGDLAMSCMEKQGLHTVGLSHYLEVTDDAGNRLPQGQTGQILVTSLVNKTMPLIRYAIKDQGSMTHELCACGNPWSRIESLEGRSQDIFYAPDGRKISPNAMVHFCWAYGTAYNTRVQMVQKDLDHLEVHLLKNGQPMERNEDVEAEMRWELENLFRVPLTIDIIWKEQLLISPTGKFRMIRREID